MPGQGQADETRATGDQINAIRFYLRRIILQPNLFKRLNPAVIATVSHDVFIASRLHFIDEMAQQLVFPAASGLRDDNVDVAAADDGMFLGQQLAQGENGRVLG